MIFFGCPRSLKPLLCVTTCRCCFRNSFLIGHFVVVAVHKHTKSRRSQQSISEVFFASDDRGKVLATVEDLNQHMPRRLDKRAGGDTFYAISMNRRCIFSKYAISFINSHMIASILMKEARVCVCAKEHLSRLKRKIYCEYVFLDHYRTKNNK